MGLTKSRGRYATLCIPDSIYGLTLAWVTSENSTKLLESDLHKNTIEGTEKIEGQTNKHEQSLGLTKSRGRYATLCIPDSIYGLTLAWVTSENSTKLLESDSSWLTVAGPYLLCYCLPSPVLTAPVRGSTPTLFSPLCCPTPTALVRVPCQLPLSSFVQPTLIRVPFPLPDTARFHVQESFVWFHAKTDKGIVCFGGPPT